MRTIQIIPVYIAVHAVTKDIAVDAINEMLRQHDERLTEDGAVVDWAYVDALPEHKVQPLRVQAHDADNYTEGEVFDTPLED